MGSRRLDRRAQPSLWDPGALRGPCAWCGGPVPLVARSDSRYCGKRCRQSAWRFYGDIGRPERLSATDQPRRFAYADPPYPGKAGLYPEHCEVDHASLVDQLVEGFPDGWALSTSSAALREVLALCPAGVRVASWVRAPRKVRSRRAVMAWEPVILAGGRPLATDAAQDLTDVLVARGRFRAYPGAITGMKPPAFSAWVFRMLGAAPGDELVDLFPGSGAVSRAWARYTSLAAVGDVSRLQEVG